MPGEGIFIGVATAANEALQAQMDANAQRGILTWENSDITDQVIDPSARASLNADARSGDDKSVVAQLKGKLFSVPQMIGDALNPLVDTGRNFGQRLGDTAANLIALPSLIFKGLTIAAVLALVLVLWFIFRKRL
jgi:hypothetical protein